jgi:hypothetical protein
MAAELVNAATSEKLSEIDWMKNIEISELVARDQRLPPTPRKVFFFPSYIYIWCCFFVIDHECPKSKTR